MKKEKKTHVFTCLDLGEMKTSKNCTPRRKKLMRRYPSATPRTVLSHLINRETNGPCVLCGFFLAFVFEHFHLLDNASLELLAVLREKGWRTNSGRGSCCSKCNAIERSASVKTFADLGIKGATQDKRHRELSRLIVEEDPGWYTRYQDRLAENLYAKMVLKFPDFTLQKAKDFVYGRLFDRLKSRVLSF